MSSNVRAGARGEPEPEDYDPLLEALDSGIAEAQRKVESGRVLDAENEKVRIKWIRVLAYAVNVRRQVTNDRELVAMKQDLEEALGEEEAQKFL